MFELYENYNKDDSYGRNMQHNIMCLVGNGFDVAALTWLNNSKTSQISRDSGFGNNVKSSYEDFYNYLEFCKDNNLKENYIYIVMEDRKKKARFNEYSSIEKTNDDDKNEIKNWADFEGIIGEILEGIHEKKLDENNDTIKVICKKQEIDLKKPVSFLEKLEKDMLELQRYFSVFLNKLLPAEKIVEFDRLVSEGALATKSLSEFLSDLGLHRGEKLYELYEEDDDHDLEKNPPNFPFLVDYGHMLNFLFVDFCYTPLLDSYIEMDRGQLNVERPETGGDPKANFKFYRNFKGKFEETGKLGKPINTFIAYCGKIGSESNFTEDIRGDYDKEENYAPIKNISSRDEIFALTRILTQVIHPHGIQDAPRSILFGTENCKIKNSLDKRWRLIKSLWARDEEKYLADIKKTQLFIIFGMSVTYVDGWWMSEIYKRIVEFNKKDIRPQDVPELIIYNYIGDKNNQKSPEDIRRRFFKACIYVEKDEKDEKDEKLIGEDFVRKHIYVVNFDSGKNIFLGFSSDK